MTSAVNATTSGLVATGGNANTLVLQTNGVTAMTINSSQVVSFTNPPVGTTFPSGTVMLFAQTSAPSGWTKDTTLYNNSALRVVTGTASTGGSVDFTTAFASQTPTITISAISGTAGATTLTTPQIPSHTHPQGGAAGNATQPGGGGTTYSQNVTGATGGGGSHDHPFSFTSGTATSSAINLAVKYVDVIRAAKD